MIVALLVAVAAYAFAGQHIPALVERLKTLCAQVTVPKIDGRHVAGIALLAAAAVCCYPTRTPEPTPAPPPPDAFSLRGKFVGPTAADDAAAMAALCSELASCIEYDALHGERLKTGVAFDDLRIAARDARMKGESIGARQPAVRDAVHQFLDEAVGTSGGPVTPESRAAWVSAFRDIARACENVTR